MNDEMKTTGKADRQSQISNKMQLLGDSFQLLESSIEELSHRIVDVLRQSTPQCDKEKVPNDEQLVPLAEGIENINFRSQSAYRKISDLLNRLEL